MNDANRDRAGEYVLGLLGARERDGVARAADLDADLAADVAFWENALAPLNGAAEVAPPPQLFERIQATIASRSQLIPGTLTVRRDEGVWEPLVEGIERKMLWHDRARGRLTFLIRAQPGSRFPPHSHDEDEEAYLLSGELIFGSLTLRAGDYHRAGRGAAHTVGFSPTGCMLLVTAAA